MSQNSSLQMSQGYEVLPPKSGQAYPIPCQEWDLLKSKVQRIVSPPSFFSNAGSILTGAALSTLITILLGTFNNQAQQRELIIAWAVVIVCLICGGLCYVFSRMQEGIRRVQANEIISQMELIENRYK